MVRFWTMQYGRPGRRLVRHVLGLDYTLFGEVACFHGHCIWKVLDTFNGGILLKVVIVNSKDEIKAPATCFHQSTSSRNR